MKRFFSSSLSRLLKFKFLTNEVKIIGQCDEQTKIEAIESKIFQDWIKNIENGLLRNEKEFYQLNSIDIQSVDKFSNGKIGFIKLKPEFENVFEGIKIPAITLLRGGSVAVMIILECEEDGEEYCLFVKQPRVPTSDFEFVEMCGGMIDESDNLESKAIEEIEEETGLDIIQNELHELTDKIFLSPGITDEWIKIYYTKIKMKKEGIKKLQNQRKGIENEIINLVVVPIDEAINYAKGASSIIAITFYQRKFSDLL